MNQNLTASISTLFTCKEKRETINYRIRLNAAVTCVRLLLKQGLSFRGNDESELSLNKGNYLEVFRMLADNNEKIKSASIENAPQTSSLVSSFIQKYICIAFAAEVTSAIIKDIGDKLFTILVDESPDASMKEQMAVCLRYVNNEGQIIERFLGVKHVTNTTAALLKETIVDLLKDHGLSISRLRGQGYDGAANMQGKLNGLKTLILNENPYAFYVHCFAHQLQLSLVAVAKFHFLPQNLFEITSRVINMIGGSSKRQDILRDVQSQKIIEALIKGELISGRGLNQETNLQRAGDTRWSSHYKTLVRLIGMFSSVLEVLDTIIDDPVQRVDANLFLRTLRSFEFAFSMHLMKKVLGITHELSLALQKKEQDIENAMRLVQISKQRLQCLRDDGWDSLVDEVSTFCLNHEITISNMSEKYESPCLSKRKTENKTNDTYFRIECFYGVLDKQLMELNNRFSERNADLLRYVGCLNPINSFAAFNKESLVKFARLYPRDFSSHDLDFLDNQLETYIIDMCGSIEFSELVGIGELAKKLVESGRHTIYPLVYQLLTLALTLSVATASVERVFSSLNIVKDPLRNKISDDWLNDLLVPYVEKEILDKITNEAVIQRFQTMKSRREVL